MLLSLFLGASRCLWVLLGGFEWLVVALVASGSLWVLLGALKLCNPMLWYAKLFHAVLYHVCYGMPYYAMACYAAMPYHGYAKL